MQPAASACDAAACSDAARSLPRSIYTRATNEEPRPELRRTTANGLQLYCTMRVAAPGMHCSRFASTLTSCVARAARCHAQHSNIYAPWTLT